MGIFGWLFISCVCLTANGIAGAPPRGLENPLSISSFLNMKPAVRVLAPPSNWRLGLLLFHHLFRHLQGVNN